MTPAILRAMTFTNETTRRLESVLAEKPSMKQAQRSELSRIPSLNAG